MKPEIPTDKMNQLSPSSLIAAIVCAISVSTKGTSGQVHEGKCYVEKHTKKVEFCSVLEKSHIGEFRDF